MSFLYRMARGLAKKLTDVLERLPQAGHLLQYRLHDVRVPLCNFRVVVLRVLDRCFDRLVGIRGYCESKVEPGVRAGRESGQLDQTDLLNDFIDFIRNKWLLSEVQPGEGTRQNASGQIRPGFRLAACPPRVRPS